jgi:hypothetical protein
MQIKKTLILLFLIQSSLFAQIGGSSVFSFLNLPLSARVSAIGGNSIAIKDNDLNGAVYNPSLLTDSMDNNVALNFNNHFAKINYGYVAYARKIKNIGNFSFGMQFLDYGRLTRADEVGNTDGTFGANDLSLNISYARSFFNPNLSFGITLKTISSQLETYSSYASLVDIGASYVRPEKNFVIGAVLKNMGRQWKPYQPGNREKMPFEAQIGFSKKPQHVPFRFSVIYENLEKWDLTYEDPNNPSIKVDPLTGDVTKPNKYKVFGDKLMRHIVIGGEFIITKNFFLRVGYNYQRRKELKIPEKRGLAGVSFGFGFKVYKFHISYARAVYSIAGPTNNFSLTFNINSFYNKATF